MAIEINDSDREKVLEKDPGKVIKLSPQQLAQWRSAMQPVWDQFRDEIGEELINAALESNNP
jgi:C4-dicarboxylate-binding protein DctP